MKKALAIGVGGITALHQGQIGQYGHYHIDYLGVNYHIWFGSKRVR